MKSLYSSDPQEVLNSLGIDYKEGHNSYKMNIRGEKHASAYISLKGDRWIYKDFGSDSGGNIVNVVMDSINLNFKEALNFSLDRLNLENYFEKALKRKHKAYKISIKDKKYLQKIQMLNKQKSSSQAIPKVIATYEVTTNELALNYLKLRGIEKIPKEFKIIVGEYQNKTTNEIKKVYGIGILTQDGMGADIHFLKKIGNLKTFAIGKKDISFFENRNSNKISVFESKMDYAAAYQQVDLSNQNIVIANTTSNAFAVSNLLNKKSLCKEVTFFNQNDKSGCEFVNKIMELSNIIKANFIEYKEDEKDKDINDLLLDKKQIFARIKNTTKNEIQQIINKLSIRKKVANQFKQKGVER
ncbi:MAG: toprim domain-containing protein [Sulfurospirillum sp.]|nr:toprim domain-containing protein [Sulfurospirillum sp.]